MKKNFHREVPHLLALNAVRFGKICGFKQQKNFHHRIHRLHPACQQIFIQLRHPSLNSMI